MKMRTRLYAAALPAAAALLSTADAFAALSGEPVVEIETSLGRIKLRLYPARAPRTVENFIKYAEDGFYDGTIFHRVIAGFMIQGGGFDPSMNQKRTRAPIPLEARGGMKNFKYTIAMARTMDPNSATSQFFINVADNDFLNADQAADGNGYAVFGEVIAGYDVVDKISEVSTGTVGFYRDVPKEPVVIKSVRVLG